jgi:hypothetical protein
VELKAIWPTLGGFGAKNQILLRKSLLTNKQIKKKTFKFSQM